MSKEKWKKRKIWIIRNEFLIFKRGYPNHVLTHFENDDVCIMIIEGPIIKVMLMNEVVKCPLLKPKFKIGTCNDSI
jgi:hypothetical protein